MGGGGGGGGGNIQNGNQQESADSERRYYGPGNTVESDTINDPKVTNFVYTDQIQPSHIHWQGAPPRLPQEHPDIYDPNAKPPGGKYLKLSGTRDILLPECCKDDEKYQQVQQDYRHSKDKDHARFLKLPEYLYNAKSGQHVNPNKNEEGAEHSGMKPPEDLNDPNFPKHPFLPPPNVTEPNPHCDAFTLYNRAVKGAEYMKKRKGVNRLTGEHPGPFDTDRSTKEKRPKSAGLLDFAAQRYASYRRQTENPSWLPDYHPLHPCNKGMIKLREREKHLCNPARGNPNYAHMTYAGNPGWSYSNSDSDHRHNSNNPGGFNTNEHVINVVGRGASCNFWDNQHVGGGRSLVTEFGAPQAWTGRPKTAG